MSSSLRDALRQSGVLEQFKPADRSEPQSKIRHNRSHRDERAVKQGAKKHAAKPDRAVPRVRPHSDTGGEIDLAKAYAMRAQSEQRDRAMKEQAEREAAERRRAQREHVATLLEGKVLNRDEAEIARHFEYGGKIRRVYVTDEQLRRVNDGVLGVIQMRGRYLLVERALAESIREVDAHAVALLVDPEDADATD